MLIRYSHIQQLSSEAAILQQVNFLRNLHPLSFHKSFTVEGLTGQAERHSWNLYSALNLCWAGYLIRQWIYIYIFHQLKIWVALVMKMKGDMVQIINHKCPSERDGSDGTKRCMQDMQKARNPNRRWNNRWQPTQQERLISISKDEDWRSLMRCSQTLWGELRFVVKLSKASLACGLYEQGWIACDLMSDMRSCFCLFLKRVST